MSNLTKKHVLATALAEKGYCESPAGSNRTKYGVWYGMNGVAWCAEFVSWCFRDDLTILRGKYARTDGKARILNSRGLFHHGTNGMKKGDVVFYNFNGVHFENRYLGICHTGLCIGELADGRFVTIEGNTSAGNNANGGQVQVRYRASSSIAGYYRPTYYVPPVVVATPTSTPASTTPSYKMARVTALSGLNVRTGPGKRYRSTGKLKWRTKVPVVSTHNGWRKIKYNGKTRYASATYLKMI